MCAARSPFHLNQTNAIILNGGAYRRFYYCTVFFKAVIDHVDYEWWATRKLGLFIGITVMQRTVVGVLCVVNIFLF